MGLRIMYNFFSLNGFDGFKIIHLTPSFEQALANQVQFPLYNYIFELYVPGELGRCCVNFT